MSNVASAVLNSTTFNGFMSTTGGSTTVNGTSWGYWGNGTTGDPVTVPFVNTYPSYTYWYCYGHGCWGHHDENKTERAYKIVRALMEAKVVKIDDMEKFFQVMDKVAQVL